jgi:selenium metabolism protein YedF
VSDTVHPGARVIAISSDVMGHGDEGLGMVLMRSYLHTLTEVEPRPDTIVFFNNGVRLGVEGSATVDDLRAIAARGTQLLFCGTCVNAFELTDKMAVGEISNMWAISETMLRAASVINL